LLPGANAVARRAPAGLETDALVASQLWLEIRQFPWWRHQKVAGNVLANMRSVLAREATIAGRAANGQPLTRPVIAVLYTANPRGSSREVGGRGRGFGTNEDQLFSAHHT
jgi:hypothetical protein